MLFSGQAGTKYRRVPRDIKLLSDFRSAMPIGILC